VQKAAHSASSCEAALIRISPCISIRPVILTCPPSRLDSTADLATGEAGGMFFLPELFRGMRPIRRSIWWPYRLARMFPKRCAGCRRSGSILGHPSNSESCPAVEFHSRQRSAALQNWPTVTAKNLVPAVPSRSFLGRRRYHEERFSLTPELGFRVGNKGKASEPCESRSGDVLGNSPPRAVFFSFFRRAATPSGLAPARGSAKRPSVPPVLGESEKPLLVLRRRGAVIL
jgi:hypothetical protein